MSKLKIADKTKRLELELKTHEAQVSDIELLLPKTEGTLMTEEEVDAILSNLSLTDYYVARPIITTPAENDLITNGEFAGNEPRAINGNTGFFQSSEWEFYTDPELRTLWKKITSNTTTCTVEFPDTAVMYARVRYIVGPFVSNWSIVRKCIVPSKPYIAPAVVNIVYSGESIGLNGSEFTVMNGTDTHKATSWFIIDPIDNSIVFSLIESKEHLTSVTLPNTVIQPFKHYRVFAIYYGNQYNTLLNSSRYITKALEFIPEVEHNLQNKNQNDSNYKPNFELENQSSGEDGYTEMNKPKLLIGLDDVNPATMEIGLALRAMQNVIASYDIIGDSVDVLWEIIDGNGNIYRIPLVKAVDTTYSVLQFKRNTGYFNVTLAVQTRKYGRMSSGVHRRYLKKGKWYLTKEEADRLDPDAISNIDGTFKITDITTTLGVVNNDLVATVIANTNRIPTKTELDYLYFEVEAIHEESNQIDKQKGI